MILKGGDQVEDADDEYGCLQFHAANSVQQLPHLCFLKTTNSFILNALCLYTATVYIWIYIKNLYLSHMFRKVHNFVNLSMVKSPCRAHISIN